MGQQTTASSVAAEDTHLHQRHDNVHHRDVKVHRDECLLGVARDVRNARVLYPAESALGTLFGGRNLLQDAHHATHDGVEVHAREREVLRDRVRVDGLVLPQVELLKFKLVLRDHQVRAQALQVSHQCGKLRVRGDRCGPLCALLREHALATGYAGAEGRSLDAAHSCVHEQLPDEAKHEDEAQAATGDEEEALLYDAQIFLSLHVGRLQFVRRELGDRCRLDLALLDALDNLVGLHFLQPLHLGGMPHRALLGRDLGRHRLFRAWHGCCSALDRTWLWQWRRRTLGRRPLCWPVNE